MTKDEIELTITDARYISRTIRNIHKSLVIISEDVGYDNMIQFHNFQIYKDIYGNLSLMKDHNSLTVICDNLEESREWSSLIYDDLTPMQNISFRNRKNVFEAKTIKEYHCKDRVLHSIPQYSDCTEEFIFQQSLVKNDWTLKSMLFFAVLNHFDTPLFYADYKEIMYLNKSFSLLTPQKGTVTNG